MPKDPSSSKIKADTPKAPYVRHDSGTMQKPIGDLLTADEQDALAELSPEEAGEAKLDFAAARATRLGLTPAQLLALTRPKAR